MDSGMFQQLYNQYHQDIFQFLLYMVKDRTVAEDLSQEVYIKIIKSYDRFEGKSTEKTWMFSIARHVAIDYFRKQKTIKQRILGMFDWDTTPIRDEAPIPEEIALQNEEIRFLYEALDSLTVDQRLVIVMRFFQQLSVQETAEALNFTESKVKTTQHRAMKVLKDEMNRLLDKGGLQREAVKVE